MMFQYWPEDELLWSHGRLSLSAQVRPSFIELQLRVVLHTQAGVEARLSGVGIHAESRYCKMFSKTSPVYLQLIGIVGLVLISNIP